MVRDRDQRPEGAGFRSCLPVGAAHSDVVLDPLRRELLARRSQLFDELDDIGIVLAARGGGAEIGDLRA